MADTETFLANDDSKPPAAKENHVTDAEDPISIKDILAELDGKFPMDEEVIEALPEGSSFLSVEHFGTSAWTITGRIMTRESDGTENSYFLKVAYGEHGGRMLKGEFESSKDIFRIMPDFIPQPLGFGKYREQNRSTYFYLSEFVHMDVTAEPEEVEFTRRLAEMHKITQSPTGKFGYHVPTCDGRLAHTVEWEESWAVFYQKLLDNVCKLDVKANGPWPEMERASKQVAMEVIPRLLEPLQTEGRQLKPSIIHGDLWEGNMGINMETGSSILFDAGSYYAHNEMELGHWRCEFTSALRPEKYKQHYLLSYPAAEPAHEFDDRNRLYSLKGAINYAAGHPGSELRKTAYNNMCYLCEKYAPIDGIDKYDPQLDPSVTGSSIVPHVREGLL